MSDDTNGRRNWLDWALGLFVACSMGLVGVVWSSSDSRARSIEARTNALEVAQGKSETRALDTERAIKRIDDNLEQLRQALIPVLARFRK